MQKWILASLTVFIVFFSLIGCADDEMDDLAKAQDCLDKITDANHANASRCFNMVAKHNSQQANIIKCSAKFMAGGLTTSKVVDAYKELEDSEDADNKEAIFISYLSLDPLSLATDAATYCRATGIEGFVYLADLAVVGSVLGSIGTGFSNPPTEAEVTNALTTCQTTPAGCEPEILAGAVTSVADTYCKKPSSTDDKVCQDINAAIAEANGNNDILTQALTCLLEGKSYTNGTCS